MRELRKSNADVILVDRCNHHLFQPLLYQVATATLDASDIASPIRTVLRRQQNAVVVLSKATAIDLERQQLMLEGVHEGQAEPMPFDWLVIATGAHHAYFGHDDWAKRAPGLKTLEDAIDIRSRFLLAFENAEVEGDDKCRRAELTFVIVGGGPTGCELAGSMAQCARCSMPRDFRGVDTRTARIVLIQGGDRVLPTFSPKTSARAQRILERLGVEVRLNQHVTDIKEEGVFVGDDFTPARNVFWAAGVQAPSITRTMGIEVDRAGRIPVGGDCAIAGHPNVFAIGDVASATCAKTGRPVPGVAQGAIQTGRHVGRIIAKEIRGKTSDRPAFKYFDKGSLASLGSGRAVADIWGLSVGGRLAWLIWGLVHIMFLVGFRNRISVMVQWSIQAIFHQRGARLIAGEEEVRVKLPELPSNRDHGS
ncbi:MAG: NAD(P)/FAD-dependent oxidoreductase [Phycisphaerales bacterium]|nr:NAD(P)/FAD-dependent oxidoreductase [Phycisphaerales bacterium]